jgi:hypothetical protein
MSIARRCSREFEEKQAYKDFLINKNKSSGLVAVILFSNSRIVHSLSGLVPASEQPGVVISFCFFIAKEGDRLLSLAKCITNGSQNAEHSAAFASDRSILRNVVRVNRSLLDKIIIIS